LGELALDPDDGARAVPMEAAEQWEPPDNISRLSRMFVVDYINGLTAPPDHHSGKRKQKEWFGQATLHSIHAVFLPPDVTGHEGARDCI